MTIAHARDTGRPALRCGSVPTCPDADRRLLGIAKDADRRLPAIAASTNPRPRKPNPPSNGNRGSLPVLGRPRGPTASTTVALALSVAVASRPNRSCPTAVPTFLTEADPSVALFFNVALWPTFRTEMEPT